MAETWVTDASGGKICAKIKGWIEVDTNKSATVYVWGCAGIQKLPKRGVRATCYVDGVKVATKAVAASAPSGTKNVAVCSGTAKIVKTDKGRYITLKVVVEGEKVDGAAGITKTTTVTKKVWISKKVLYPPSPPKKVMSKRESDGSVRLTWLPISAAAGNLIDGTQVQRCKKGGSWTNVYNESVFLISYLDMASNGTFKYRVRYFNDDGYSSWSNETDFIPAPTPPAAPRLGWPLSGRCVDATGGEVEAYWQHNSIDKSDQTAAKVWWSTDNETFQMAEVGEEDFYNLPIEPNQTYYWKVATRGCHADYGPESGVAYFKACTPPVAVITAPQTVQTLPVTVSWEYGDAYGEQLASEIIIYNEDDEICYRGSFGGEASVEIPASAFTPLNQKTYIASLRVTSTTGLWYKTQAAFYVDYIPPAKPTLAVTLEKQSATNTITVFAGTPLEEDQPETAHLSLFRDGELIAEGLYHNSTVVDETPPLDRRINYRVVAYGERGEASEKTEIALVPSNGFAFLNFNGQVAKLGMNLSVHDQTNQEKEYYSVASAKYQKVFYGERSERTGSLSADVFWSYDALDYGDEAMLSSIEALKEHDGLVHLRLPYGDSFVADVDVSIERSTEVYNIAAVSVEWRRVQ